MPIKRKKKWWLLEIWCRSEGPSERAEGEWHMAWSAREEDDYCLSIVASIQDHIAKINRNTFTNYTSETEI